MILRCFRQTALVCAIAWAAMSCASAPSYESRASVEKVVTHLADAVNSADLDGLMSLFAPEATVFLPSAANPSRLSGLVQIRAGFSPALEARPANPLVIRDLQITVEGPMA